MADIKLIRKSLLINESQQPMLDQLIENWGFISESEVIRQAITFFYRKYEPKYLQPTPTEEEKAQKRAKEAELAAMTDEEYCMTVIKGKVVSGRDGTKFCITHSMIGNSVLTKTVADARAFYDSSPADLEYHLAKLNEKSVDDKLQSATLIHSLEVNYGIVL